MSDVNGLPPVVMAVATRLLAELYTSCLKVVAPLFAGDLDRAMVFALFLNIHLSPGEAQRAISINSSAMALGRPFETVRRHVTALVAARLCIRDSQGVRIAPAICDAPVAIHAMERVHDVVVRYVKDSIRAGIVTPPAVPTRRTFAREDGTRTAIDIMLSIADRYRPLISDATDLALVMAVLAAASSSASPAAGVVAADAPDVIADPGRLAADFTPRTLRVATLARMFGMAESTVRRRTLALASPGGLLIRERVGVRIAPDWVGRLDAAAHADGLHGTLSFGMARVAAAGFPFDDPASAYIGTRPPLTFD